MGPVLKAPVPHVLAGYMRPSWLAVLLLVWAAAATDHPALHPTEAFLGAEGVNGYKALYAPQATLGGTAIGSTLAPEAGDCATACRNNPGCDWFNYCNAENGCIVTTRALVDEECLMMTGNCTLVPPVSKRGTQADLASTAGFPIRARLPSFLPEYVPRMAQGIDGGDFHCNETLIQGWCAFSSVIHAAAVCSTTMASLCNSIMVYSSGMDGCGKEIAVLKSIVSGPSNSYMAPTVYLLERVEGAQAGSFLHNGEATLILPAAGEVSPTAGQVQPGVPPNASALQPTAADGTGVPGGSNSWLGCIVAVGDALMAGEVLETLDDVPSAVDCCRECRRRSPSCNVFNYCNRTSGCSFQDFSTAVTMEYQQCELRFQALVDPATSGPPFLVAKGPDSGGFTSGAPIAVTSPPLEGFTLYPARGLWGQPGHICNGTLQPDLHECVIAMPLPQLGERCLADPTCAAVVYKPGMLGDDQPRGIFRKADGANLARMVYNPTSAVYLQQAGAGSLVAAGSSDGGSDLSDGAIVGISVGCTVAFVGVLGAGWALARHRGNKRSAAAAAGREMHHKSDGAAQQTVVQLPISVQPPSDPGGMNGPHVSQQLLALVSLGSSPVPSASESGTAEGPPGSPGLQPRNQAVGVRGVVVNRMVGRAATINARPAVASPFVALRQTRMAAAAAASASDGVAPQHQGGARAAAGLPLQGSSHSGQEGWPSGELAELMQHRALEEEVACLPPSGSGAASASTARTGASDSGSLDANGRTTDVGVGSGDVPQGATWLAPAALPPSLQEWLIPFSAVQYLRRPNGELAELGRGASGRVIRAVWNGEVVAAKEVEIGSGLEMREAFLTEAHRLQALRHQSVVTFFGMCLHGPRGILLTELCEGRDLASVLRLRGSDGSRLFGWWRRGCRIALEVATALNYLHIKGVVHLDIKSSNVLLTSRGAAKLSDVGLSRLLTQTYLSDLPSMVGTFSWVAPEVLMGSRCTQSVDIYSFSVLLWELFTGERPVRGHLRQPRVPEECPQEAADLMTECGSLDPAARPSAQQVMRRLQVMVASISSSRHASSSMGSDGAEPARVSSTSPSSAC